MKIELGLFLFIIHAILPSDKMSGPKCGYKVLFWIFSNVLSPQSKIIVSSKLFYVTIQWYAVPGSADMEIEQSGTKYKTSTP